MTLEVLCSFCRSERVRKAKYQNSLRRAKERPIALEIV